MIELIVGKFRAFSLGFTTHSMNQGDWTKSQSSKLLIVFIVVDKNGQQLASKQYNIASWPYLGEVVAFIEAD